MRERPILFLSAMVKAILAGRKTQTRRLVTTREPLQFLGGRGEESDPSKWGWCFDGRDHHGYMVLGRGHDERHDNGSISIPCPYGVPGDRLWCRETWDYFGGNEYLYQQDPGSVIYRERDKDSLGHGQRKWRPSIFMPRWASRITLEITEVRVQRLTEISEDDARAEGVEPLVTIGKVYPSTHAADVEHRSYRGGFAKLWDSINGDRAAWSSNPWIWALTFRRIP